MILAPFIEITGAIIGATTIASLLFYSKSQVDSKFNDLNEKVNTHQLTSESSRAKIKEDIYEKLAENKQALEDGMKEFIGVLSDIKESDKNLSVQLITLVNAVKDELKSDYTSRYNDLLLIINTKANESDFTRLEQKVDKVTETITELKTIVQLQMDDKK